MAMRLSAGQVLLLQPVHFCLAGNLPQQRERERNEARGVQRLFAQQILDLPMTTLLPIRTDDDALTRYAQLLSACFPGTDKFTRA